MFPILQEHAPSSIYMLLSRILETEQLISIYKELKQKQELNEHDVIDIYRLQYVCEDLGKDDSF